MRLYTKLADAVRIQKTVTEGRNFPIMRRWGKVIRASERGKANGLYDIYEEKSPRKSENIALVAPQAGQESPVIYLKGQ